MNEPGTIRLCGLVGLAAAIGMGISDLVMLGRPVSGREFVELGIGNLVLIPENRLFLGALLGVVCAMLYVPGFWHVAQAVRPAGEAAALVMFGLFSATIVCGAAFHAGHAFIGLTSVATPGGAPASAADTSAALLLSCLAWLGALTLAAGSLCFAALAATGSSAYPRWFAACSPLVLVALCAILGWLAPAPVGGYLWPVCFNLGLTLFFALSLVLFSAEPPEARPGDGT